MNLKALGLRFALGYLMSRSSGSSQEDAAVDSLLGSTIAQAKEDVTGFTHDIADVTELIVSDLVAGRRTKTTGVISPNLHLDELEVDTMVDQVNNPDVGLTAFEVSQEVELIKEGLDQAVDQLTRLERLQAGVLRRL